MALPLSLSLQGLSAARRGDGGLTITDDRGKVVGDSGQPVVFDASVVPGTNYPARQSVAATVLSTPVAAALAAVSAVTRSGRVAVGAGAKGKRSTWTLTPDSAWLSDASTKYPVTVDPSLVMSTTLDTYVDQTNPTNSFSTATRLYIGTPTASGDIKRAYIAFAKPTALAGMFVSDSYLQLYNSYSSIASLAPVNVYGLAAAFASTVSWGTRPSNVWTGAIPAGTANYVHNGPNNACGASAYDNVHITPLAQSWADGTNKVYAVQVSTVENDVHGYKEFFASDAGAGVPTFYTTYWAYPTVVGAPVITGATAVNGVFAANSLTPVLRVGLRMVR